jgi:hypothetical protein
LVGWCLDTLLFDRKEFGPHLTSLQEHTLPWFSNGDMLVAVSLVFFATIFAGGVGRA